MDDCSSGNRADSKQGAVASWLIEAAGETMYRLDLSQGAKDKYVELRHFIAKDLADVERQRTSDPT